MAEIHKEQTAVIPPKRIVRLYVLLTVIYLAHVCEEAVGRFLAVNILGGLAPYLVINAVILVVVVVILHYLLIGRRRGYVAALGYAAVMILNGAGHIIGWGVTGRYRDGFAGAYTGVGYLLIGPWLVYYLWKEITKRRTA